MKPYEDLIVSTAIQYNLDPDLLSAQVQVESSRDTFAFRYESAFYGTYLKHGNPLSIIYGPLGACSFGLMQIILEVAMELGFADRPEKLFIPQIGLEWGAKKMQALLKWSNNDYNRALSAYNAGMGSPVNLVYIKKVRDAVAQ